MAKVLALLGLLPRLRSPSTRPFDQDTCCWYAMNLQRWLQMLVLSGEPFGSKTGMGITTVQRPLHLLLSAGSQGEPLHQPERRREPVEYEQDSLHGKMKHSTARFSSREVRMSVP